MSWFKSIIEPCWAHSPTLNSLISNTSARGIKDAKLRSWQQVFLVYWSNRQRNLLKCLTARTREQYSTVHKTFCQWRTSARTTYHTPYLTTVPLLLLTYTTRYNHTQQAPIIHRCQDPRPANLTLWFSKLGSNTTTSSGKIETSRREQWGSSTGGRSDA